MQNETKLEELQGVFIGRDSKGISLNILAFFTTVVSCFHYLEELDFLLRLSPQPLIILRETAGIIRYFSVF